MSGSGLRRRSKGGHEQCGDRRRPHPRETIGAIERRERDSGTREGPALLGHTCICGEPLDRAALPTVAQEAEECSESLGRIEPLGAVHQHCSSRSRGQLLVARRCDLEKDWTRGANGAAHVTERCQPRAPAWRCLAAMFTIYW